MLRAAIILLVMLSLPACGGRQPLGGSPHIRVLDAAELPLPATNTGSGNYVVGPGDKITVDVAGLPGLSQRDVQVDRSGRIALPLIGGVSINGRTPAQIETLLGERFRSAFVRDPKVAVNVLETGSQVLTVDGQVMEPGIYPVFNKMTLTRAIASAKGASEFAELDDVVVLRTVNGQRYAALYNLAAIRRAAYVDPVVVADDVIVVGDSPSRRLIKNVVSVLPALASPLVVLLQ